MHAHAALTVACLTMWMAAAAASAADHAGALPPALREGLVLYYPFETVADGQTPDASGAGHAGTVKGAEPVAEGTRGAALRFKGQSEVTAPHAPELAFAATNSFTVALWAWRERPSGGWDGVIAKSRLKPPFWGIYVETGSRWVVYTGPLKGPKAEARWTHVALVQDGAAGKRRLFIDGAQAAECPAQDGSGPGILAVGSGGCGYAWFQGLIDEVCIFRRALDPEALKAVMAGTGTGGVIADSK